MMIGQPWMSIFVGAVMPRQNTAFASEERKTRAAARQATATQTKNNRCIGFIRRDKWFPMLPRLRD
ncbi:hypothetical protein [Bradyrhizobium sp. RDM4]|uniref:hypothetical protein n=1 Tax=Bradyrhizobium sp. RDM4 TaxID=3378765 RepID=UPI0038FCD79A